MIFAIRYPDRVNRLILNGANLNPMGVKRSTQIPIEIGYKFAKKYAEKSDSARLNAEMLGLMVNDPNVEPEELVKIKAKTLVIAGTKDMIKKEHTRLIASHIPDSELVFLKGNHFKVTETNIPYQYQDKNLTISALMKIRLLKRYAPEQFTFEVLKSEYGIYAIRGPRGVPNSLSSALKG